MTITTSRGKTFDVNWAWAPKGTNKLMIEMQDTRPITEISEDFDGLKTVERKSEAEGDRTYDGYNELTGVVKNKGKGTVQLTLEKEG